MGPQQILRAIAGSTVAFAAACVALGATASAAPREPVAVIDLGPDAATNPAARQAIAKSLVAAGLEPALEGGLGDAFAGVDAPKDAAPLATAMADAQQAFGALDCAAALEAAHAALPILAARQAGGVAVPELPKALAYLLLCADRTGDAAAATHAATELRALGASPDVAADLLAKYPDAAPVAAGAGVTIDVDTDVPGAPIWIDFQQVGPGPLHVELAPGDHVIAAAKGTRRGSLVGTPVASQPHLVVPMIEVGGKWASIAARVASWHGGVPSGDELNTVLVASHVRVAIVRHGDAVEVWGHAGGGERVTRLDDTPRTLAQTDGAAEVAAEKLGGWSDHAPDPSKPLLVEDRGAKDEGILHEKWWVYAAIGAALAAAITVVAVHHYESDTQQVELHYP